MAVLEKVNISTKIEADDFLHFLSDEAREKLLVRAAYLKGKKIVHVSATAKGGGVAEILQSLVPYLRSLGVSCEWYAIRSGEQSFFKITNAIHDALQGAPIAFETEAWAEYERVNDAIARELAEIECNLLAINDPQPLLAGARASTSAHKIYFSHIDTSTPHERTWQRLFEPVSSYDRIVFSNALYANARLSEKKVRVFTPAIDPLSPKQGVVPKDEARRYLERYGHVPSISPLIVQVSRFDAWKNPLDVIRAFSTVRTTVPEALLALVGFNDASDNPTSLSVYQEARKLTESVPNVYLFFDIADLSVPTFTMMAQNAADIVVQNSTREGFGLTVAEAMWKCKPVVGGPGEGIRTQITDGENGFIVQNRDELVKRLVFLLGHPEERQRLGRAAHETVCKKFLFPRLLNDHVTLYQECLAVSKRV